MSNSTVGGNKKYDEDDKGLSLNPSVKFKVAEDEEDEFDETRPFNVPEARRLGGPSGAEEMPSTCLFIEMAELNNGQAAWSESARWMKFEEDVEQGGRWSKPHVATVPLHSLFELRQMLLNGVVLLDIHIENFADFVDQLMKAFEEDENSELSSECILSCRNLLMYRHTHQHERHILRSNEREDRPQLKPIQLVRSFVDTHGRGLNGAKPTNPTSSSSVGNSKTTTQDSASVALSTPLNPLGLSEKAESAVPISETKHKSSFFAGLIKNESHDFHKTNSSIMKKLPPGTEATNVLIGGVDFLEKPLCAFVRFDKAQELGDLTEVSLPTKFMFVLLGPQKQSSYYHEVGRSISTLMSDEVFRDLSYKAEGRDDLIKGIDDFLEHVMVLPPGEWDPATRIDPPNRVPEKEERMNKFPLTIPFDDKHIEDRDEELLQRTGRCCGGLIDDIKRKAPWFVSDITDAMSFQCLASIFFMYFACLSPIVTFGGLLSKATDGNMGAMESLLAAAVCGFLYHTFAGQPLTILGSTGPVLVFESIIFKICSRKSVDFMGFRAWIGMWVFVILALIVMTDGCSLIRHITRFTEESFAALIGLIFIWEAFMKMSELTEQLKALPGSPPSNCTLCMDISNSSIMHDKDCVNNSAMRVPCISIIHSWGNAVLWFSVFLFGFTFLLAFYLKRFKSTNYLPAKLRLAISNFSVLITVVSAVVCDLLVGLKTPKLDVPHEFHNTRPGRGWFISPFGRVKWYQCLLAFFPAVLATILVFMDQNITTVIINRRENKLKKGCGYHLDMLIVSLCILINSLFGLPWFVAATVLSVNHVISLKVESTCTMPGEKPRFIGVIEQRVTGFVVYLFIGLSVFLTSVLKYVPMPVLYGIFLLMGVSSLAEIQFWNRILLLFMPEKYQPDYVFLRHVSTGRVHLFTLIQVACMVLLWVVKSIHQISITFPIMVLALIGVRKALSCIFSQRDLMYLDDAKPECRKRAEEDAKLERSSETVQRPSSKFVDTTCETRRASRLSTTLHIPSR